MIEERFDAIVVGSGFGGSVSAYRLAEAGLRVCLLERGRAYPPGSFPRSPYRMRENFWDPSAGLHGLFNVWSFPGIAAVVASGLGGGSLIYANVLLRKDASWFARDSVADGVLERWPVTYSELEPHYERVEQMLEPVPYPLPEQTPKTRAFRAAAERAGLDSSLPPLAVTFANEGGEAGTGEQIPGSEDNLHGKPRFTCRLVGECDLGCNFGSKNTLDFNYLSAAQRLGAELRTRSEVRSLEPAPGGGYRVGYVDHASEPGDQVTLSADRLVLAAGTFGSTYLLLRNRSAFPKLSPRLGQRFSGNGDLLTFATGAREPAPEGSGPRVLDPSYGPVITSAVRVADELDPGGSGRGFYLEDAGFPGFVTWALQVIDTPGVLWRLRATARVRLRDWLRREPDPDLGAELSALFSKTDLSAGVLPLLGMGRDIPDGTMRLRRGRLDLDWRKHKSGAYFDRVRAVSERIAHALGADFHDSPLWYLGRVITVHPLGGCPMGGDRQEGVVDSFGEVFGYRGLYVADGAVMPGPVGPNPSLTIAALADRFADRMLEPVEGVAQ
jgi:cholesterol oxidase